MKGIVEDRNGRLWITTQNGLSVYDPKLKAFTNYSQYDGLISPHFYWNSAIKDASGTIFLGSEAGLIEMLGENAKYSQFKAFAGRKVYNASTSELIYIEAPFRPDIMLKDLVSISNPDLVEKGYSPRYYKPISE